MEKSNESKNKEEKEEEQNQTEDLLPLITSLIEFEKNLKSMENINSILTKQNLEFFKKLTLKENIRVNLLLSKIYINIISNNSLYNDYLLSIEETDKDKISNIFLLIENCISLIEKLNNFIISSDIFLFKNKILDLLKCIYYNCKTKIKEEEKLAKLLELMNSLPSTFFSESFLELNKLKELYEIIDRKDAEKITLFEEKFSKINNYYEQYDVFKKFIEYNSGVNFSSIGEEIINKINETGETEDYSSFYTQYGTLILKFCKYHKYMFLDKEEENITNKENEEYKDEENNNKRIVFLFDRNEKEKKGEKIDKEEKIQSLLKNKQFISLVDSKEYRQLIKKEIKYYLKITNKMEEVPRIKLVREHLLYYLKTLDIESYYPLYLKNFTKISINDNFTPSFSINVPAGTINKLYFETPKNEDTFVYLEFSLDDKTKDINFELNKYDTNKNKYIPMFKEEKIQNTLTFLIFCDDYSLYEIVFDNYYSWFNSKDINYRLSLLKLKKDDQKEYDFLINGKNYSFEKEKNLYREEEKNIIIPVILDLNVMKICSIKSENNENENEDNKNENNLVLKEYKEEGEKIISKHFFNYLIVNHIKKNNLDKENRKIKISIFSQNNDLLSIFEEIKDKYEKANKEGQRTYIKNIGFFPDERLDEYNLSYQLYDKNEQIIFNHIYTSINNDIKISKSFLLIGFGNQNINAVVYNKGEFYSKIKGKNSNLNNIYIDSLDELLYLIKDIHSKFEGLELILSLNNDIKEENKIKVSEQIEKIKKYCQEIINPPIKIFDYDGSEICQNAVKYMNLFINDY